MNWNKRDYAEDAKISILERISYALGNMGNCIGLTVIAYFMLFFYNDILGLSAAKIATIMLVSRVFDGVTDLGMGYIIDRTHSSKGKARVWLLRGCIPYTLSVIGIFFVPAGASDTVKYIYIFILYNLANAVFGTVVNTSYNSMNSLITKNSYETGVLGIFGMVGATMAVTFVSSYTLRIVGMFGDGKQGWHIGIVVIAGIGLLLLLLCYQGTRERVLDSEEEKEQKMPLSLVVKNLIKNKYWLMVGGTYIGIMFYGGTYGGSLVYYCKGVLGDTVYQTALTNATAIPQLLATMGAFIFVKKFGKGNTFRIGNVILIISLVLRWIVGANPSMQTVLGIGYGIGSGMMSSEILGLLADTVEYGLWKTGVRIVGSAFAVMSFAAKIGNGLGSSAVGWLIEWGGYDPEAAVQGSRAIFAINACFIYLPLICAVLILLIMSFYKLDKEFDQILADNKARSEAKSGKELK